MWHTAMQGNTSVSFFFWGGGALWLSVGSVFLLLLLTMAFDHVYYITLYIRKISLKDVIVSFEPCKHSGLCLMRHYSNLLLKSLFVWCFLVLCVTLMLSLALWHELERLCSQHNSNWRRVRAKPTHAPVAHIDCRRSFTSRDFCTFPILFSTIPLRAIKEDTLHQCYDSVINARRFTGSPAGKQVGFVTTPHWSHCVRHVKQLFPPTAAP